MNQPLRDAGTSPRAGARHGAEGLLFLVTSVLGTWALGNGVAGLSGGGPGLTLLWFAVAAGAIMILFSQMGRVHDSWPRRASPAPSRWASRARNRHTEHEPSTAAPDEVS